MLVPIIILVILNNRGILPKNIYYILIVIIGLIGSYFFWRKFSSIIMRDNMNYQEYAWGFDQNKISKNTTSDSSDPWNTNVSFNVGTCVGNACCTKGLIYDTSINQCILQPKANQKGETVEYQSIYSKAFLPTFCLPMFKLVNYNDDTISSKLRGKKNSELKLHEKFVAKVTGEWGCKELYKSII